MNQLEDADSESVNRYISLEAEPEELDLCSLYKSYSDPQQPRYSFRQQISLDQSLAVFESWVRRIYQDRVQMPELHLSGFCQEVELPAKDMIECIQKILTETCWVHHHLIKQEISTIIQNCRNYYSINAEKAPTGYISIVSESTNPENGQSQPRFSPQFLEYCSWLIYQHYCSICQSNKQVFELYRIVRENSSMAFFKSHDKPLINSELAHELFFKYQSFSDQISDEIEILSQGESNTLILAFLVPLVIPELSDNFVHSQLFAPASNTQEEEYGMGIAEFADLIVGARDYCSNASDCFNPSDYLDQLNVSEAREYLGKLENTIFKIIYSSKQNLKKYQKNLKQFGQAIKVIKNRLYRLGIQQYAITSRQIESFRKQHGELTSLGKSSSSTSKKFHNNERVLNKHKQAAFEGCHRAQTSISSDEQIYYPGYQQNKEIKLMENHQVSLELNQTLLKDRNAFFKQGQNEHDDIGNLHTDRRKSKRHKNSNNIRKNLLSSESLRRLNIAPSLEQVPKLIRIGSEEADDLTENRHLRSPGFDFIPGKSEYDFLMANQSLNLTVNSHSNNIHQYLSRTLCLQKQDYQINEDDLYCRQFRMKKQPMDEHQSSHQNRNKKKNKKKKKKKKINEKMENSVQQELSEKSSDQQCNTISHLASTSDSHRKVSNFKESNRIRNQQFTEQQISQVATATVKLLRNLKIEKDNRIVCYDFGKFRKQAWIEMSEDNLRRLSHETSKKVRKSIYKSKHKNVGKRKGL